MNARKQILLIVMLSVLLIPRSVIAVENYVLDMFEGNIEEKDITIQLVNDGSGVELRTWNVFCVYFPLSDKSAIEAHMEDTPHEFVDVDLSGTLGGTDMTYGLHSGFPDWWWTNPNIEIKGIPSFPQYYKISMRTNSGQTGSVNKAIYTFELPESLTSDNSFTEETSSYAGSFRVKEHDFGQLVMLDSIAIDGHLETSHGVEIRLYGKIAEEDEWSLTGIYNFTRDVKKIFFDEEIYVRKVKYGLTGTEGIKLIAEKTNDTPGLWTITLTPAVPLEIIGSPAITLFNPIRKSPKEELFAQGFPLGGEYEWTIVSGEEKLQFVGNKIHGKVVSVKGKAPSEYLSDVVIKVTYTVNSQSCYAFHKMTVQKPTLLKVVEGYPEEPVYRRNDVGQVIGYSVLYAFQVFDQLVPAKPITTDRMIVKEERELCYRNYNVGRIPKRDRGLTNKYGCFEDELELDTPNWWPWPLPEDLSMTVNQQIFVEGWAVHPRCQIYYYDEAISVEGICSECQQ